MKKQFEAYYSEKWALLWLILAMIFVVGIVLFSLLWIGAVSLIFIITLSIFTLIFLFMYKRTKNRKGIAVEIIDDVLILHKKETISIPLKEIQKIDINDTDGSFDIIVTTVENKVSLHCSIHEQRQKKNILIDLLKSKNVKVSTYDLL